MNPDIRWVQRFDNYKKALAVLERTASITVERSLSEAERQGLVQGFEFTFELAWNVLKDYLEALGFNDFHGSISTIRIAFREGLIENGEAWMDMVKSRNDSSHTYNVETADKVVNAILNTYIDEFRKLTKTMDRYYEQHIGNADGC
ncbi:nucleotidyltransferase substrate binding protein [Treponema primitia]|uniref:nucleotidyltransferase substrate binding protein n=1 Tax=Treponema primitia TaxID=88058 RepID=UPI0002555555|nr:nucleotidyltransferase substrate binding protein [Treponema primitia]